MSIAELEWIVPARRSRAATTAVGVGARPRETAACRARADCVTSLFPTIRPRDSARTAVACRSSRSFDAQVSATTWIIAEGLAAVDPDAAARIVEGWRLHSPDLQPLVTDEGCDIRVGGVRAGGAVRTALLEWLPLTSSDLAVYEGGLFQRDPAGAVTLLVRPPTVWSLDEAALAERLFPRGSGFEPGRFAALERYAHLRVGSGHLRRLRDGARRIEQQLPFEALPAASAVVTAGCASVAADDDRCAAIAARQLARYATSALVAAEARRRATAATRGGARSG